MKTSPMSGLGVGLFYLGSILIILGAAVFFVDKIPFLGKLPGDIYIKKGNLTVFIPFTSMLLLSVIVSLAVNFFRK